MLHLTGCIESNPMLHGLSLAAIYLIFSFIHVSAQSVLTSDTDAFINKVLSDWNSPGGVAVAFVRQNGEGVWNVETKGYGVATANGTKVTEKTLFVIASNSKVRNRSIFLY